MAESPEQLSIGERAIVGLDTFDSDRDVRVVGPVAALVGAGVGFATYHGIKEFGFPSNDQHEEVMVQVNAAERAYEELTTANEILERHEESDDSDLEIAQFYAQQAAIDSWREAALLREDLPQDYNSTLEGLASGGGAILAGSLVTASIYRFIRHKAQSIRART